MARALVFGDYVVSCRQSDAQHNAMTMFASIGIMHNTVSKTFTPFEVLDSQVS